MKEDDIVDPQSVERIRAITERTAVRVVAASVLAGLGGALFGAGILYAAYGIGTLARIWFVLGVFPAIGAYQAVHWWRHYRSVLRQLDSLATRMAQGEVVYGSQVRLHSYR